MSTVPLSHDPQREEAELREYLGDSYDHLSLQQSDLRIEEEFREADDEEGFYRSSQTYLYNLTAFAMTGTKLPYLEALTSRLEPGARVLDYGCGIGSDGLMLLEAGYRVEFADFANPSTTYLAWRLKHRGLEAPIHDLDTGVPGGFDAAYSFDVIEHVGDPFSFLDELEGRAGMVAVNLLAPVPGDIDLHHDLPIRALVNRVAPRLVDYRVLHGRSHLVIYTSDSPGPIARLRGRSRAWVGLRGAKPAEAQ